MIIRAKERTVLMNFLNKNWMKSNILVVVVIYEENIFQTEIYDSLLSRITEPVYVYDNSSKLLCDREIPGNWTYVFSGTNDGISHAYNTAAQFARISGIDWLLFCDQDTRFPYNYIETVKDTLLKNENISLFAPNVMLRNGNFLSPLKKILKMTKMSRDKRMGIFPLNKYAIINSGMVVSLNKFWECGGYNEKVWLDFSDLQFIDRYCKYNSLFYIMDAVCIQNFSNLETDYNTLKIRYNKFCDSVSNYEATSILGNFEIYLLAFKRAVSLSVRTKKISFIKIFLFTFFLKKRC